MPKYASTKLPINNEAAKKTQTQAQTLRIKNEIKFLYKKKQQLNTQLYHAHIHNANIWQQTWDSIEKSINHKLQQEMKKVYLKQQEKLTHMNKIQNTGKINNNVNYTRVENRTNIQFTQEEIQLLNKGLKYNLHQKNKKWIEILALEAETAISRLHITEQNYYRHAVAKKIKDINRNNNTNNKKNKYEWKQIMNIKNKISENKLTITKADKGKTLVILTQDEYKHKVKSFIQDNQFQKIRNDPTQQYQKMVKQTLKQCNNIIQKEHRWRYTNMNPIAPNLHATIKLHKQNTPIRPIINWKNAPAYELAKQLSKTLNIYLQLPNAYNVRNSMQLMTDLKDIVINKDMKLCSFDIENMYTNIPKIGIKDIINKTLENLGTETNIQKETMIMLNTIMEQNYFQFEQENYKQVDGLAMGAPTSSILAETYIQYMEHTQIYPILIKHQIIAYFRYVDDILIIYDQNKTNIDHTLNEFNRVQTNINFTMEKEEHQCISFLDIVIHRNNKNLEFAIYRKPTQTDIIIPNSSCHPHEHKRSGINYLLNRLYTYPITRKAKDTEMNTIQNILYNNEYDIKLTSNIPPHKKQKENTQDNSQQQKTKWVTFTYSGKEVRKVTKLFRDAEIKVAFRTQNTIQNILKPQPQIEKYNRSGIYQMKCLDCPLKYVGQTGRTFKIRYKEHIHDIKSNSGNSSFK